MRRFASLYLLALALLAGAWPAATADNSPRAPDAEIVEFAGEIVYVGVEGGFYGIVSDSGKRYKPLSLPAEFHQEGLRVRVTARPARHLLGFHMWGEYIEILSIVPTGCQDAPPVPKRRVTASQNTPTGRG